MGSECFRINEPDVIHQLFDQEVVVIDLRSGSYFSLSEVAGKAWLAFGSDGAAVDDVAAQLIASHDATPEVITTDLRAFLHQLCQYELIAPSELSGSAVANPPVVPNRARYSALTLQLYNDLQELFLLDPVHEVDQAAGWPHPAPVPAAILETVVEGSVFQALPGDVLTARPRGSTILVNRDNGLYCTLDEAATSAWNLVQAGPVAFGDPAFARLLLEAGLIQPVTDSAATAPKVVAASGASLVVHRDLEQLMRPWIPVPRPIRGAASVQTRQIVDRLDQYFDAAAERIAAPDHRWYRIGGKSVHVRSSLGEEGNRLQTALSHLATAALPDAAAALTISVWNSSDATTGPVLADLLGRMYADWRTVCGPRGEVLQLHSREVSAIYNPGPDVLSVIDFTRNRAWCLKRDSSPFPYWEVGSPFRFLLHEWFASQGLQYVHGGAVGNANGGVLMVGKGGSGKSTTSLLCAAAGMDYAGDDYCLADAEGAVIHSLYNTGKLTGHDDFVRLPELRGLSTNPDSFEFGGDGKAVYALADAWPGRVVADMPLRAILIPRITGQPDSGFTPCSASDALLALLPSTVGQLPAATNDDCDRMSDLVNKVPAYVLHLGTDISQIPRAVSQVLAR